MTIWTGIAIPTSIWLDEVKLSHFLDHFDDGFLDAATVEGTEGEHLYSRTLGNGDLIEEGTYCKFTQNDPNQVGYSRLVMTELLNMIATKVIEQEFLVSHSTVATGFSIEREVGNTAYRGDIALLCTGDQIRLFYREYRGAPQYNIVLMDYDFKEGDRVRVIFKQTANQSYYKVSVNGAPILEGIRETYSYTSMYAVFGGRSPAQTEVGRWWMDYIKVYGEIDPGWNRISTHATDWMSLNLFGTDWEPTSVPITEWEVN